jgi:hypothetical protein
MEKVRDGLKQAEEGSIVHEFRESSESRHNLKTDEALARTRQICRREVCYSFAENVHETDAENVRSWP